MSIWMVFNFLNQFSNAGSPAHASQRNVVVLGFGSPCPPFSPLFSLTHVMISNGSFRSLTKCFTSNVERFAFMSRTCLRTVWHINHVVRDNKSPCSLMCLFNVEILSVFRWTCLDYTRLMNGFSRNGSPRSLLRTRFFAKRINIDLLRTGRFSFILHTDHVMRDIGSPRSLTYWI